MWDISGIVPREQGLHGARLGRPAPGRAPRAVEPEGALVQAWMKDDDPAPSAARAVERERSRSIAAAVARPSRGATERALDLEQAARAAPAPARRSRARRPRSRSAAGPRSPGLRLVSAWKTRTAPRSSDARRIVASRSPRFRAEPDVRDRHGPLDGDGAVLDGERGRPACAPDPHPLEGEALGEWPSATAAASASRSSRGTSFTAWTHATTSR